MSDETAQTPLDLGPLEADFAALQDDLARISELPVSLGNAAAMALEEIIKSGTGEGSEPVGTFARTLQDAIYGVMKESTATDMHGNMTFNVDQHALAVHGVPVMREVVTVVQDQVQAFMNGVNTTVAAASASEPAAPAATPDGKRPAVKFKLDLMSLFTGLVKDVTDQATKPPKKG